MLRLRENRYVRAYIYNIEQAVMLGNGVLVGIDEPGQVGYDEMMEHIGGGETLAQRGFPLRPDTWYTVQVTARGNFYTIEVGGQELLEYTDVDNQLSPRGTIGFTSNSHIQIDRVLIQAVS